ncbi:MAG: hypothetical protein ACYS0G_14820 [Planctomycetota bacterium]
MKATQIVIALLGAVLTVAIWLASKGGMGVVPEIVVEHIPGQVRGALPWAWKVLGALVFGYVAVGLLRRLRHSPVPETVKVEAEPPPPPLKPRRLPPIPRPPDAYLAHRQVLPDEFVGRAAERQALTDWLRKKKVDPVQALVAPGGMGKSAAAWVWLVQDVLAQALPQVGQDPPDVKKACRLATAKRPKGVIWWSFDQPGAGFSVFLAKALTYLSGGAVKPTDYLSSRSEKLQNVLSLLRKERFLLVLDGFERELRAFSGLGAAYQGDTPGADERVCGNPQAAEFLRRIATEPMESRVLLISRLLPAELDHETASGCSSRELDGMEAIDAVSLMQGLGIKGDEEEIKAAGSVYGFRPLALHLLAGVIRGGKKTGTIRSARRYHVPPDQEAEAQNLIVEAAFQALDRPARKLLSHIAAFRSPVTTEQVAVVDPTQSGGQIDDALGKLVGRGLLAFDPEAQRYDLHPVVRCCAYGHLAAAHRVHDQLADYFARVRAPSQITTIDELEPTIELYHHLLGGRRYEEAFALLARKLTPTLRDRFQDQQMHMELLRGLFVDGDAARPSLKNKADQARVMDALAKAYSYSGETRRAVALCQAGVALFDKKGDEGTLVLILSNLAGAQSRLGSLEAAEESLRRLVELTRALERGPEEAVARNRLGLLLSHRGAFDEALAELDAAFETTKQNADRQIQSVCFSYYAQRALLMGDPEAALDAARKARAFVEEAARRTEPDEHDFVRSGWLLGASLVATAASDGQDAQTHLPEAERYLADALARCRRGNLVGFEPDLLLVWSKWQHASGRAEEAARGAEAALAIADRCSYRLKQAEVQNFLARLALERGDRAGARERAELARERARCDGPPYCYQPAMDGAEALLRELEGGPRAAVHDAAPPPPAAPQRAAG